MCEAFNKMVEMVRQEEKDSQKEKYPWLDDTDERKYMMDREILDKYIMAYGCLRNHRNTVVYFHILVAHHTYIRGCLWG